MKEMTINTKELEEKIETIENEKNEGKQKKFSAISTTFKEKESTQKLER